MTIQDIKFTLKDGREAILHSPRPEDAEQAIAYMAKTAEETHFLMRYPEECKRIPVEKEISIFESKNASPSDAMMVCTVEGKLAGICEISFYTKLKIRHRATVAVAQLREFWNQGIGTKMFEEMIRLAKERPEVTQLELEFIEGNDGGRHLYEKMGFRITGVRPNAIRLKDGTLLNEYLMIKEIKR